MLKIENHLIGIGQLTSSPLLCSVQSLHVNNISKQEKRTRIRQKNKTEAVWVDRSMLVAPHRLL